MRRVHWIIPSSLYVLLSTEIDLPAGVLNSSAGVTYLIVYCMLRVSYMVPPSIPCSILITNYSRFTAEKRYRNLLSEKAAPLRLLNNGLGVSHFNAMIKVLIFHECKSVNVDLHSNYHSDA